MPRNGSGTYSLPQPAFVAGTTISSSAVNSNFSDIATALTGSLPRDGQAGMTGPLKLPDGSTVSPALQFSNDDDTGFTLPNTGQIGIVVGGTLVGYFNSSGWQGASSSGSPIGSVLDYAGTTAPTGFLLCYGQNVSRTTYALLFAVIGTTYGSGDGATTFGVPDLRGRLLYGKDDMGGSAASRLTTTYFGTAPTTLGNAGGNQSSSLGTTHLPAYTPSGTISVSDPGHGHSVSGGTIGGTSSYGNFGNFDGLTAPIGASTITISSNTTGITAAFVGAAQGGAATAFTNVAPGMIMNKIIYAGA